ncbi:MAG: right-handed parallel beta-helix repeat-containing protein [Clostridiales bacterium]
MKKVSGILAIVVVVGVLFAVTSSLFATPSFDLVGFAKGTTGGSGGEEVKATSLDQVNDLLNDKKKNDKTGKLIIKFDKKIKGEGKIDCKEVENVSFIGEGTKGELDGIGLNIVKSENIIVQNMKIHYTKAPVDCIGLENSKQVWIDHCELYNEIGDVNGDGKVDSKGDTSGGDVDYYDGLLDVKKDSQNVTISWTYMHDSFKTSLVGSSDSDTSDRKITFHHNVYENLRSRTPSYRGGTGHIFNNYYVNVEYSGINSRMGAKLRIEGNVFQNVGDGETDDKHGYDRGPIGTYYSDEKGFWDVSDNIFDNCKGSQPTSSTCSFKPSYSYSVDKASSVKDTVLKYAGVGKLDGSDNSSIAASDSSSSSSDSSSSDSSSNDSSSSDSASGSVHEAEASTNKIKYGEVDGDVVAFDSKKDAYVEMKKVNSNSSGSTQITFVYSSNSSFPCEIKVNGSTVEKEAEFASTGGSMKEKTFTVDLDSGSDNKIKFKIREAVSGVKLDKVIIGDGGSSSSTSSSSTSSSSTSSSSSSSTSSSSTSSSDGDITLSAGDSIEDAVKNIKAGSTIYLNSGTYKVSKTFVIEEGNKGSSGKLKKIEGKGDVTIDFSSMSENSSNRGIVLDGSYWHVYNVTIKGAGDNGMLLSGDNNIIEECTFRENHDTGLQLSRYNTSYDSVSEWPSNNLIKNCLSTENIDSGREDADGFAPKLTAGEGNKFVDCRAEYNCDDGWDLYTKSDTGKIGVVKFENCVAEGNGKFRDGEETKGDGNGYKLGDDTASVAHELKNCQAIDNNKHGFTGNGNPAKIILDNCTGSGNAEKLFDRLDNAVKK